MSTEMQAEVVDPAAVEASSKKLNKKALVSVLLGVFGLTGVLFAAAIVAIVIGNAAKQEIDETGARGRGVAVAGVALGWTGIAVAVGLLALLLLTSGGES